jgi:hypothetical protein
MKSSSALPVPAAPAGGAEGAGPWWRGMSPLPLLVVPAAAGLTLLASRLGWWWLLHKPYHEFVAVPLLAVAVALLWRTWRARRERPFLALTVLAAAFLCREIHFTGSNEILYFSTLGVVLWVCWRWSLVRATLRTWPARGWLAASLLGYLASQLVARRVFRGISGEQGVHVALEEMLETVAHATLLVAALRSGERATP